MAVALSSLSKGTSFYLPLANGDTAPAIYLESNRFSQGESICILPGCPIYITKKNTYNVSATGFGFYETMEEMYLKNPFGGIQTQLEALIPRLSPAIQGSLVPVTIREAIGMTWTGPGSTSGSWDSPSAGTIYNYMSFNKVNSAKRVIFLPQPADIGLTGFVDQTKSYSGAPYREITGYPPAYTPTITVPSSLLTDKHWVFRGISAYAAYEIFGANPTGGGRYSHDVNYLGSPVQTNSEADSYIQYVPAFISINSKVQVSTSSNGGTVTSAMGVESYRKINGVWYRTD